MRRVLAVLVTLLVAGAFAGGYWPQREKLARAQAEAAELRRQLSEAQAQLAVTEEKARLGRLLGQLLALRDALASGNYGEGRILSSSFFDKLREEVGHVTDAKVRSVLESILVQRDTVTAGLARGDASVRDVLAPIEGELRGALGYPLPSLAVAKAAFPAAGS